MDKDKVVIEEGGMRYVLMEGDAYTGCGSCEIGTNDGGNCGNLYPKIQKVCIALDGYTCISATKTTQEPKMYFAWSKEEAQHIVGSMVESHNGNINGLWVKRKLISLGEQLGQPFKVDRGDGTIDWVPIIREIPKTPMTLSEAMEKYVPDNIDIVE